MSGQPMTRAEALEITEQIKTTFEEIARRGHELGQLRAKLPRERKPDSGNVYFIQAKDSRAIKIGFARNVESRLATLQIGCPEELNVIAVVPGTLKDEQFLHQHFSLSRLRGEWFTETPEIRNFIWGYRR